MLHSCNFFFYSIVFNNVFHARAEEPRVYGALAPLLIAMQILCPPNLPGILLLIESVIYLYLIKSD